MKVSPDNDVYGSYGLAAGMKRYNHSCEEFTTLDPARTDPFIRVCPLGVRSCFYVTGQYQDISECCNRQCFELSGNKWGHFSVGYNLYLVV